MKFSSFGGGPEKEYPMTPDRSKSYDISSFHTPFEPKEEFTRIKFDPNVREQLPELPSPDLLRKAWKGYADPGDPQSCYVAVNFKGRTYHLFNAKRMPVGRIAVACSQLMRGKHKPGYDPKSFSNGDKCIVVNIDDPLMTGRKRQ